MSMVYSQNSYCLVINVKITTNHFFQQIFFHQFLNAAKDILQKDNWTIDTGLKNDWQKVIVAGNNWQKDNWLNATLIKDNWSKDTWSKDTWSKDTWLKDTWPKDTWSQDNWSKDNWPKVTQSKHFLSNDISSKEICLKDTWQKDNWLKDTWQKDNWLKDNWTKEQMLEICQIIDTFTLTSGKLLTRPGLTLMGFLNPINTLFFSRNLLPNL